MEKEIQALRDALGRAERVATPHSRFMDITLHGKAGEIVPRLLEDGP
jgi:hypothetical protein